jgi:group I intron endonuclease
MGFIYCITSPSNKRYIGQTIRDPNKRFKEHCRLSGGCILLQNAIKKYEESNMKFEILLQINNELLNEYEDKFIAIYNTLEPTGYNIRQGGSNSVFSDIAKERMRQSKLGDKNHNFGKPRSDKTKKAISDAKCKEKHHFYGKELSIDHKKKLSESHKKYDKSLPIYIAYIKERPKFYQASGYAVVNHPSLKTQYFTSKKYSLEEKLQQAIKYIQNV